jgi:hypothetical protein
MAAASGKLSAEGKRRLHEIEKLFDAKRVRARKKAARADA